MSQFISTEIEILAPPATVHAVFMDFSRWKEWSSWNILPVDSSKKPSELKAEDPINVDIKAMQFQAVVVENTDSLFAWDGRTWYFSGKHEFHFTPSEKNPGGTTMVQFENFRGPLSFMMSSWLSFRQPTLNNWDSFFTDLKKEAEKSAS